MQDDEMPSGPEWGSTKKGDAMDRAFMDAPEAHPLDKPRARQTHSRLLGFYERELERQAASRVDMAKDEAFYDNEQWSEQDKVDLEDRGQKALVYNVISTAVNWITGTEKRGRTDYKILPRRKDASKAAQRKTQLFKYLEDVNRATFHRSRAFEDATKVGIGWLECGAQSEDDGEPIYVRYESWRNMLWDSAATELDLSDGRYQFRTKWVDLDVACAMFPDRAGMLRDSAIEGDRYRAGTDLLHGDEAMDSQEDALEEGHNAEISTGVRLRVRLIEGWYRKPSQGKRLRGGDFTGEVLDETSPGHMASVQTGKAVIIDKVMMRMRVAIFTARGLVYDGPSPYRHNRFPFTPIWAYRRGRDGMPYGIIRGLRDIQEDINKRASKALHILSTNKTIMDEGAVDDLDAYLEEVSRPDAVIVKKKGAELTINAERDLAPAHLELMARSIAMVQQVSGVTDEAMGRTTNATAGVAIQARQQQAGMSTAGLFDNLRLAVQVHGEKELSLIEQFISEEKAFRITNQRGTPEYVVVNDGLPENDIISHKADFIISEDDWRATVRQAQVAELLDLLGKLAPVAPQVAVVCLDLLVESMDIANREELVKRIRQATGTRDPDAEEPTPEEMAQIAQQQKQAAMQEAAMQAEIADKQASANLKQAQAQKAAAELQAVLATTVGNNVAAQKAALEAALLALTTPPAAQVGDLILHEAGFVSRTEQEEDARAQGVLQGEQQAQAQRQAEQQAMAEQQQGAEQQAAARQQRGIQQALEQMNPTEREAATQQLAQQQQAAAQGGAPQGAPE